MEKEERSFPARLDQLSILAEFVLACAQRFGVQESDLFAIQMAVDEAATNIILHGYQEAGREGDFQVRCWREGTDFFVQLRDRGRPFDPGLVPEPDLESPLEERREGGLGIFLMRRLMDRVEFSTEGEENVLTMVRYGVPAAGGPAGVSVLAPVGRLDATRAPELERLLRQPVDLGQRYLVVDLSQVTYLSSGGLRVLLVIAKELRERGGQIVLCCAQPNVARVLRITGFSEIFPSFETREAALRALEGEGGPGE